LKKVYNVATGFEFLPYERGNRQVDIVLVRAIRADCTRVVAIAPVAGDNANAYRTALGRDSYSIILVWD
jgi:hypothetical protein